MNWNRIDIFSVTDIVSFTVTNTNLGVEFSIGRYLILMSAPMHPWTAVGRVRQHKIVLRVNLLCDY